MFQGLCGTGGWDAGRRQGTAGGGSCLQSWCVLGSAQFWMGNVSMTLGELQTPCRVFWGVSRASVPCTSLLLCRAVQQQLAVGTGTSITTSSTWHWGTQGIFPAHVALACPSAGGSGSSHHDAVLSPCPDKTVKLWKVSERDKRPEGYNLKDEDGRLRDPSMITVLRVSVGGPWQLRSRSLQGLG